MATLTVYRIKRFFWWLCLFFCLLSWTILLTFSASWLYRLDAHFLGIASQVSLSTQQLMRNYHQMLDYVLFPWVQNLQMTDFPSSFTGAQHFADVKQLVLLNYLVLLLTTPLSVYFLRRLRQQNLLWQLQWPAALMAGVPIIILFALLINFQDFFTVFHQLLFRNQDWLFDPALDPIINALPATFFLHCFLLAIGWFEIGAVTGWLIGRHALNSPA